MSKIVRFVCAMLFCCVVLVVAVYAWMPVPSMAGPTTWRSSMYASETLDTRQQGLDIRGRVPVITEEFGASHTTLNAEIDRAVDAIIDGTQRSQARSLTFDFNIHNTVYRSREVVSIVITATARGATDRTSVLSVNFNARTGALLTLEQVMGKDIAPLAERIIADMIRQNPATYSAAFSAPPTGQGFFITATNLVLLFDEFQLSSVPGASTRITMRLENIRTVTISPRDYRVSQDRYAIKMMPVRQVLHGDEGLGFDVSSGPRNRNGERRITVSRNGNAIVTFETGVNNYQRTGVLQRSLEAAPVIISGRTYVPISFFDQILPLTVYDIDAQGNITFMTYLR